MTRHMRIAPILLLSLVPLAGCVSNLQPLSITGFFQLDPLVTGCSVQAGTTDEAYGLLDTALPATISPNVGPGYVVGIQVTSGLLTNLMQPVSDPGNPNLMIRVNTNDASLESLVVKYQFVSTDGTIIAIPERNFPVSVSVPTGNQATFPVEILRPDDGNTLAGHEGTLVAQLSFSGHLKDGSTVGVTPANFTVNVCNGCLVTSSHTVSTLTGTSCPANQVTLPCGPDSAGQPDGLFCPTTTSTTMTTSG